MIKQVVRNKIQFRNLIFSELINKSNIKHDIIESDVDNIVNEFMFDINQIFPIFVIAEFNYEYNELDVNLNSFIEFFTEEEIINILEQF